MAKILVLIRHAHRDVNFHADNNSLSEKGRLQADRLARFFSDRFGENSERVTLISSPKQRCQETLLPIARRINQDVLVDPLLDEEGAAPPRLDVRVGQFLKNWRRGRRASRSRVATATGSRSRFTACLVSTLNRARRAGSKSKISWAPSRSGG